MGTGEARVCNLELRNGAAEVTNSFEYGEPMTIAFDLCVDARYSKCLVSLSFLGPEGIMLAQCHSSYNGQVIENDGRQRHIEVTIPQLLLNPDNYGVSLIVFDESHRRYLYWSHCAGRIRVTGDFVGGVGIQWLAEWSVTP